MSTLSIQQPSVRLGDPHICSDARARLNILSALFDALVQRDAHGQFIPAVAQHWSVDDTARHWRFHLRSDLTFHNGDPLRADDVVASLRRACDPAVGGELGTEGVFASYLGDTELRAPDASTVEIETPRPLADLLDLLVDIPIVPERTLAQMPGAYVGSGPYRLVSHDEEEVVLEAHRSNPRVPLFDRIHWQACADPAQRVADLLAGHADLITHLSVVDAQRLRDADPSDCRLHAQADHVCVSFLCNAAASPCADARVRRALNYALDVQQIIRAVLPGAAHPLNGPLTPRHLGHDPDTAPYPHDPETARALLDAAGPAARQLTLDVPTTLPDEAPALAEIMAEQYAAMGIETTIRTFADRPAYAQLVKAKQIDDACCFDSSPLSTYRVLYEKFHSGARGPWWQGYHNAEVNALLEQASATPDVRRRRDIYRRIYRLLHADAPWIFLYRPVLHWGLRAAASSVRFSSEGLIQLYAT
jgi:peptide/nickel transport system substrate-binding protein